MRVRIPILVATALIASVAPAAEIVGSISAAITSFQPLPSSSDQFSTPFDEIGIPDVVTVHAVSIDDALSAGTVHADARFALGLMGADDFSFYGHDNSNSYSETGSFISISDLVNITSSTLPVGTPVTEDFSEWIHGFKPLPVAINGPDPNDPDYWYAHFRLVVANPSDTVHYVDQEYDAETEGVGSGPDLFKLPGVVTTHVGDQLLLAYTLNIGTYTAGFSPIGGYNIDYYNTVNVFADADPANPDVKVVSTTGYTYLDSSVENSPEPSTGALFLTGIAGLLYARRARKQSLRARPI